MKPASSVLPNAAGSGVQSGLSSITPPDFQESMSIVRTDATVQERRQAVDVSRRAIDETCVCAGQGVSRRRKLTKKLK